MKPDHGTKISRILQAKYTHFGVIYTCIQRDRYFGVFNRCKLNSKAAHVCPIDMSNILPSFSLGFRMASVLIIQLPTHF